MANKWIVRASMLAVTSLLAATAQAIPAAAVVVAPTPPVSPTPAPSAAADAALQRDLHLSTEQIRTRQAREATAPDVEQAMRATLGERFGGAWLSRDGTLHIGVIDSRDSAAVRKAGATPQTVAYSERQLDTFKTALDRRAKAAPASVRSWYVDLPANKVVITVESGQTLAAAQAFGVESGVHRQAVQVVTRAQREDVVPDAEPSRPASGVEQTQGVQSVLPAYPLSAGEAFYHGANGRCSVGFAVNGGGFLTAGHCNTSSYLTGPDAVGWLGTWERTSYPGNDYAWVKTSSLYEPIAEVKGIGGVAGREAVVGTAVCRSGSTTGVRCGYILHKGVTHPRPAGPVHGLTETDACADHGDSGGPFMAGDQAQGIASSIISSCGDGGGYTYYQPVNPILSAYGLTLKTGSSTPPRWWDKAPHNSERGTIQTDVNGDGRDDVVAFYQYANNQTKLWVFLANASGGFDPPTMKWDSGAGAWDLTRTRFVGGDFDGDGRDDIAALYDYGNNWTKLWVFFADGSGGFWDPVEKQDLGARNWNLGRTRLVAGDFDGDGLDDIGALYGYDNDQVKLWVFRATGFGWFAAPVMKWDSGTRAWDLGRVRLVAGDFDGDGRADVGALYSYVNDQVRLWVFSANGTGGFDAPVMKWDSGTRAWDLGRVRLVAGDFDGDGRADVGALYSYVNDQVRLWVFSANGTGGFDAPVMKWDSGTGAWDLGDVRLVAGDFNGDGHVDIGSFYNYVNDQVRLWSFRANGSGGFHPPIVRWDSGTRAWDLAHAAQV